MSVPTAAASLLMIGDWAILPDAPTFAAFAVAGLLLNLAPGADMTFVAAAAARGGTRRGILAALGVGTGVLIHITAAVLGLSALLAASATAFAVLRWCGVAYLLWIAVQIARSDGGGAARTIDPLRVFRDGLLINALNPKVAIFFLAFLPQFIPPHITAPAPMIAALGLWFDLVGTAVNIVVALVTVQAARYLATRVRLVAVIRYLTAGLLAGLAVKLAVARR